MFERIWRVCRLTVFVAAVLGGTAVVVAPKVATADQPCSMVETCIEEAFSNCGTSNPCACVHCYSEQEMCCFL